MQPPQTITFHCPSCGMKLQVPEQMAGVTGPCPQCSASIIAPQPTSAPPVSPPAPSAAVAPQAQAPVQQDPQPQPSAPLQQPPAHQPVPQQPVPQQQQPVATSPQAPQTQPQQPASCPAPLQKTEVSSPTTEPIATSEAPLVNKVHRNHKQAPRRPRWMKVVFPLAFLLVAAVLVLVVLQAIGFVDLWKFGKDNTSSKLPVEEVNPAPAAPAAPVTPVTPEPEETSTPPAPSAQTPAPARPETVPATPLTPATPVAPPRTPPSAPAAPPAPVDKPADGEFPDLSPPPPGDLTAKPPASPPSGSNPPSPDAKSPPKAGSLVKKPRFKANELLDQFLAAKTLEERLPLMTKSTRSQAQLMASCLAGPLKPVKSNYFSEMVPRLEDDMRQYLYYVAFEDKQEERERMKMVVQLVERPGIHPPRVHADAFIEHYEKLLDAYALKPSKKITTFHCIAEARTADLVKNLPEDLKGQMIRLVIMSHPGDKPAFDAFLNKNSPLMEQIGPRGAFPYVEPRFCVLSFRWNTKNPKYPYIELVDIVTLGWEK